MEYCPTRHLKCLLRLDSGRNAILENLDQSYTYAGLLEGTPNKKANDWGIDVDMKRAANNPQKIGQPYLIPPVRRDYKREPGDIKAVLERMPEHPPEWELDPEWLPLVCCIGRFQSGIVSDKSMHASFLTVVWYQDEFAMPIAANILTELQSLEWDSLATDIALC